MATLGINLSPQKKEKEGLKVVYEKIKPYLILFLIFYSLIVALLFGFQFYLLREKSLVQAKTSFTEAKIKSLEKREMLEIVLKGRTAQMLKILKERTDYASLLEKVQNLSLQVPFRGIGFDEKKITLEGEAANVSLLNEFLEKVKGESDFPKVALTSLSRTKEGGYSFSLELFFHD